jgi:hypothetical protein
MQIDLSKIELPNIDTTKLPQLPSLDKLIEMLNTIQSGKLPNITSIPGLENVKLPDNLPPLQVRESHSCIVALSNWSCSSSQLFIIRLCRRGIAVVQACCSE